MLICATEDFFQHLKFLFIAPYLLTCFICGDQLPFSPPLSSNVLELSFVWLKPCIFAIFSVRWPAVFCYVVRAWHVTLVEVTQSWRYPTIPTPLKMSSWPGDWTSVKAVGLYQPAWTLSGDCNCWKSPNLILNCSCAQTIYWFNAYCLNSLFWHNATI